MGLVVDDCRAAGVCALTGLGVMAMTTPTPRLPDARARVERLRDAYAEGRAHWIARGGSSFADTADALSLVLAELDRLPRLQEALEAVEWEGYLDYGIGGCAECKRTQDSGHTENCIVGLALTAALETP